MPSKDNIWTFLFITFVAVVIWFWAANGTREQTSVFIKFRFVAPEGSALSVTPSQGTATLSVQGSRLSLQKIKTITGLMPIPLGTEGVSATPGMHQINLSDVLTNVPRIRDTGVRILTAEPASIEVQVDELLSIDALVAPNLPLVQVQGKPEVEPTQVKVRLPRSLRPMDGEVITVEPDVQREQLASLEPGKRYDIDVLLRVAGPLAGDQRVIIEPATARISFTVRSRVREFVRDSVRIQIAGPPEDQSEYLIEIAEPNLRNVTVRGDDDLIRRIESDEIKVVAVVHLSTRDKEEQITSKRVSYFAAVKPDGSVQPIEATVNGSSEMPVVAMKITERAPS